MVTPMAVNTLTNTVAEQTPLKRFGQTLDIAKGVVFLASNDASFITGANLVIDGGFVHNYIKSYQG